MFQWSRALAALVDDQSSAPKAHIRKLTTTYNSSSRASRESVRKKGSDPSVFPTVVSSGTDYFPEKLSYALFCVFI